MVDFSHQMTAHFSMGLGRVKTLPYIDKRSFTTEPSYRATLQPIDDNSAEGTPLSAGTTRPQKNRTGKTGPASLCVQLAVSTHLSEALAAENGTVGLGLEGHLCLTAATGASSGEELTGATGVVLASVTASLAALGLVLEAALCVEFLLTCGENEFVAALFAN